MNGRLGFLNSSLPIDDEPSDRLLEKVEVAIGVHRRDPNSQEGPTVWGLHGSLRIGRVQSRRTAKGLSDNN